MIQNIEMSWLLTKPTPKRCSFIIKSLNSVEEHSTEGISFALEGVSLWTS
jgi:hypothetical protein